MRFLFLFILLILPVPAIPEGIPFYLELLSDKTKNCFLRFFETAVSNDFSCSRKFNFLEKDNVKKRASFTAGKDCFLRIVQEKCDPDRYDVFNYYYEELVDTLTFIPAHSGCSETYYRLNAQRCYAQKKLMEIEIERQLERHPGLKNSTEVMVLCKNIQVSILEIISNVPKFQDCMEGLCFTEDEQSEIEFSLVVPELTVSHFAVCILTIDKELPDLSKYKCLENQSFYVKTPEFLCERYRKSKRECLRAVTQDYCGRDVVKPVEKFLDDLIDLKCKNVLFGN
ncbi:Protein CBG04712 [Caenorhabditis briggsae]|uniref:Protein CBG04712 n=1 Tax=Caenorhabditis briggsae TaxID=6238 RepID=A8WYA5_CAEBR|nr:Protein CBG04712 [Caenorhabditis briggsae]CAP25363.2 Protein CBG04712 [Caenorhabditis briggsae]